MWSVHPHSEPRLSLQKQGPSDACDHTDELGGQHASEISQNIPGQTLRLHEAPRGVTFIERESNGGCQGLGAGVSRYVMETEFHLERWRRPGDDSGEGRTTA